MKFTNIPKNGASWSGELLYSFATELAEPGDVQVIVRNAETDAELGCLIVAFWSLCTSTSPDYSPALFVAWSSGRS